MFERVAELSAARVSEDIVEYIYPIEFDGQVYGYIYSRATTKEIQHNITQAILVSASVLVISLIACLGIGYYLQSLVSGNITQLIEITQKATRPEKVFFKSRHQCGQGVR